MPALFGPYNPCPRQPQGYAWETRVRGRFGSVAWGFNTFAEALDYARDQYANAVEARDARRSVGDEYSVTDFWATIDGPGGRLGWSTIEKLVTR